MSDPKFDTVLEFTDKDYNPRFAVRMHVGRYHYAAPAFPNELFCNFETVEHMEDGDTSYPWDDHAYGYQMNLEELRGLKAAVDAALGCMEHMTLKDEYDV